MEILGAAVAVTITVAFAVFCVAAFVAVVRFAFGKRR